MEWYIIEFLYPNSFKRFTETMFPNVGVISLSILEFYDIKKLYRFFDLEGIYLTVEMLSKNQWVFSISTDNGTVLGTTKESRKNREEVEIDGFQECFRVLDKKIKDNK